MLILAFWWNLWINWDGGPDPSCKAKQGTFLSICSTTYVVHCTYNIYVYNYTVYIVVVLCECVCVVCSKWNIWHLAQCKSLDNNEEAIIYSCYVPPSLGFLLFVYARLRMRIRERMVCHKIEPFHHTRFKIHSIL